MARKRKSWIKRHMLNQQITRNRWSMVLLAVMLFMIYMIGRNAIHAIQIGRELMVLNREAAIYQESITRDSTLIERLKIDSELERYARENFYMKRRDEELFIIKDK